jgi:hypothetical protein
VREIARAVGLPRTSVHRVIQQFRAAQQAQSSLDTELDDELAAEAAAVLAKYAGGFDAEFDIADADPELVARLVAGGVDLTHPDAAGVLAPLTRNPADPLTNWRIGHLPRTAEWLAGHDMLGRPLPGSGWAVWPTTGELRSHC